MKVGEIQKLDNITYSSTVASVAGFDESNIGDENSLKLWKVKNGAVTLTLEFDSITADAVCLFNCNVKTSVQIITYSDLIGTQIETKTIPVADLTGLDSLNALFELTSTTPIVSIDLVFLSSDASFYSYVGYIWVGDLMDFKCLENLQPMDNSSDDGSVTRANTSDTKRRYNFQEFNLTTKEDEIFETVRSNVRTILESGNMQKRPFLFDEPTFSETELVLGVIMGGKFGYDVSQSSDLKKNYSQLSFKIREVQ